jgi:hypothetical protein
MNRTEAAYSNHLALLKAAGEILDFSFEPEKLKIGPNCHYTPDFRVLIPEPSGEPSIQFHEVKGTISKTNKPFIEDDALVKIKAAAELHPYKFIIVWFNKGTWERREIN